MTQEQKEAGCTLTNEELIERAEKWVHKLAQSGGKDWCLRVPVDFNNDPDMLFIELCNRLKALTTPPEVSGEKEDELWEDLAVAIGEHENDIPAIISYMKNNYSIKRKT